MMSYNNFIIRLKDLIPIHYGRSIPIIMADVITSSLKEKRFYLLALYYIFFPVFIFLSSTSSSVVQTGSGIAIFYAHITSVAYIKTFYLSFFLGQILLVILTADLIAGEIESKTFSLLRTKPIYDSEIVLGKFFGIVSIFAILDIPGIFIIYFYNLIHYGAKWPQAYFGTLDELLFVILFLLLLQSVLISITLIFSSIFSRSLYSILGSMLFLFLISTISNNISPSSNNYLSMTWLIDAIFPYFLYNLEPISNPIPSLLEFTIGILVFIMLALTSTIIILRNKEIF